MRRLILFTTLVATLAVGLSAQEVFTPGDGVSLPSVVKQVKPNYTEAAIAARIEGDVVMQAVVLAGGTVGDVTVTTPLDSGLDEQAVNALKQWQFNPGTKDGKPVAVRVYIQMNFSLR